jgi:transposase InsO family protein
VNTVAKIMAELGLAARRKRRRRGTTRTGRGRWRAPDLVERRFSAPEPNRKWFGDGTEIVTDEGKLYLDTVLDVGSRRVVGFGLSAHHDADLACAALQMAVAVRGGAETVDGLIFHSDQGGEYTGHTFRRACQRLKIRQSMGRPGSALDNAIIESWHSTLEFELRQLEHYTSKTQARAAVAAFIDDYNRVRRHSALNMMSPIAFEAARGPADPGMTGSSIREHGTVLAGVKAKPSGWPTASPDPSSGRCEQPPSNHQPHTQPRSKTH